MNTLVKEYKVGDRKVVNSTKLLYVKENPKRKNSAAFKRFAKYMRAKTVEQFLKLGGTVADLRYDSTHEFVDIK